MLDMVWYYLAFCVWYYNRANLCVVNSNEVTGVNGITCCAPSLADDITCIRTTPRGLPRMFDIYTEYANKWMFQFNELKSCVVQVSIFSVKPDFDWTINQ